MNKLGSLLRNPLSVMLPKGHLWSQTWADKRKIQIGSRLWGYLPYHSGKKNQLVLLKSNHHTVCVCERDRETETERSEVSGGGMFTHVHFNKYPIHKCERFLSLKILPPAPLWRQRLKRRENIPQSWTIFLFRRDSGMKPLRVFMTVMNETPSINIPRQ